jgi:hypothetical protein
MPNGRHKTVANIAQTMFHKTLPAKGTFIYYEAFNTNSDMKYFSLLLEPIKIYNEVLSGDQSH